MSNEIEYSPKGCITFAYVDDDVKYFKEDYPEDLIDMYKRSIYGDFMSGNEFYNHVDSGCITDYDGSLGEIYIDGYRSNLGLFHKGMSQGYFLVDGPTWLDICDEFDVEVVWCNK